MPLLSKIYIIFQIWLQIYINLNKYYHIGNNYELNTFSSYLMMIKVEGYNSRVWSWKTIKIIYNEADVETWKKLGTGYLLRETHGGETTTSKCKLI